MNNARWMLLLMVMLGMVLAGCERQGDSKLTELVKIDRKAGSGTPVEPGKRIFIHYTAWLYSEKAPDHHGRQFDSSYQRDKPQEIRFGSGENIKGLELGLEGMQVGGQRTLMIPPALAYGEQGLKDKVPANATLVFDIEIIDVRN